MSGGEGIQYVASGWFWLAPDRVMDTCRYYIHLLTGRGNLGTKYQQQKCTKKRGYLIGYNTLFKCLRFGTWKKRKGKPITRFGKVFVLRACVDANDSRAPVNVLDTHFVYGPDRLGRRHWPIEYCIHLGVVDWWLAYY